VFYFRVVIALVEWGKGEF